MALERLESFNQIATAGVPDAVLEEEAFSLVLRTPNGTPDRQESEAGAVGPTASFRPGPMAGPPVARPPVAPASPTDAAADVGLKENQFSL